MSLVGGQAEDLLHPVRTCRPDPWVLLDTPAIGQSDACIGIGELAHPHLLLCGQRLGEIVCLAEAVGSVVAE